jgi:hypothetical protein
MFRTLAFWCCAAAAAHAQQQYQDPTGSPGTYFTQRTTAPSAFFGQPRLDVTYFIGGGFTPQQVALIRQAAAVWSNTTASVNLVEVGTAGAGAIDFQPNNINDVTFDLANRIITSNPGPGTYPDGSPWRRINNTLIIIDSIPPQPYFTTSAGPVPAGQFSFFSLVLREFGFGLGLGFATTDPNSVMDSDLTTGEQHLTLTAADLNALQTLYGTPEPETWALLGIGLGVLIFRRKFIF